MIILVYDCKIFQCMVFWLIVFVLGVVILDTGHHLTSHPTDITAIELLIWINECIDQIYIFCYNKHSRKNKTGEILHFR